MQGARAAALQWLLLAVTAINDSRDGWSGSALPRVNKHTLQHIWQMLKGHHPRLKVAVYDTHNVTPSTHTYARTDAGVWDAYLMHGCSDARVHTKVQAKANFLWFQYITSGSRRRRMQRPRSGEGSTGEAGKALLQSLH